MRNKKGVGPIEDSLGRKGALKVWVQGGKKINDPIPIKYASRKKLHGIICYLIAHNTRSSVGFLVCLLNFVVCGVGVWVDMVYYFA